MQTRSLQRSRLRQTWVFLTGNRFLPPLTIAALCQSRWQVGLLFKSIMQHRAHPLALFDCLP